jgi:hypothetical protein
MRLGNHRTGEEATLLTRMLTTDLDERGRDRSGSPSRGSLSRLIRRPWTPLDGPDLATDQKVGGSSPSERATSPQAISRTGHLLLDFDGPGCSVFAGMAASQIAAKLRHTVKAAGFALPSEAEQESDPLEVFRAVATLGPEAAATGQQLLTTFDSRAVETARPTPGSADLIITAYPTGRTVAIVSNNSTAAIMKYLADHRLSEYIRLYLAGTTIRR